MTVEYIADRHGPLHMTQRQVLLIPIVTGFVLGWAGTNSLSGMPRFPSAIGGMLLSFVGWGASHIFTLGFQHLFVGRLPLLWVLFLGVFVSGIISVPGSYAVYEIFSQLGYKTKGWAAIYEYSPRRALAAAPGTIMFWVAVNYILVRFGVPRFGFGEAAPVRVMPAAVSQAALDSIFAKMRPEVRGPVLAVQAEAHFIRVYTTRGQDLISYRFGEAVEALASLPGVQVHRSWWVVADAIDQRRSSGTQLLLTNGLVVPVGRTYLMDARRSGLLD